MMAISVLMRSVLEALDRGDSTFQAHLPDNLVLATRYANDIAYALHGRGIDNPPYELKREQRGYSVRIYW